MVIANRYINVGREVDGKQETIDLVPGQEVPDWAVDKIKPEHLGTPRDGLEETDQFLISLRETARKEGIEFTDEWDKEQLAQAITASRQAAATHTPLDLRQFGPSDSGTQSDDSDSQPSGSTTTVKPAAEMTTNELREEHNRLLGDYPHHNLTEDNLRKRVAEAQDKAG